MSSFYVRKVPIFLEKDSNGKNYSQIVGEIDLKEGKKEKGNVKVQNYVN